MMPLLTIIVVVVSAAVTADHVTAETVGHLSDRLSQLYHSRPLSSTFYVLAAVLPTFGLVLAGLLLPEWRPLLWAASCGGYLSDRCTVHGYIERKSLRFDGMSMPGSRRRGLLVLCAVGMAGMSWLTRHDYGVAALLVTFGVGTLPFALLPGLQELLREGAD